MGTANLLASWNNFMNVIAKLDQNFWVTDEVETIDAMSQYWPRLGVTNLQSPG
jgi:hypothetical protein